MSQHSSALIVGVQSKATQVGYVADCCALCSTGFAEACLGLLVAAQGHPVAEVFLILWAFEYLIEGASGFGTPVSS